ncbi:MAG: hypothetical protein FWG22_05195, partial [Prolixibacteraceae bacterium]|nr:hypothetical protein [Prolixibacteraceae bacterium]
MAGGQDEAGGLFLSGKITTEQGNVGSAVIKLFKNGKPMPDYQVDESGRYNLRFEFNNEYVLVFMRADNFPQKYTISTTVSAEVLRRDRKFPPFPADVNLFTEVKGIDRTFSENTVMRIFYSASVDNFISETYYNNAQIKKLIDQAIAQSQNVSREADYLKRLSNAELAALKKEYNELLKQAGGEFDKGEYVPALDGYKKASRIFPTEQFPKDRIAEINDLIAILGLEEELARQEEAKYNQFIQQGDKLFDEKAYPGSKENYGQALLVRPGDAYATGKISQIDQLMAQLDLRQKYDEIIAQADNAFADKQWESSKKQYQEALKILPAEPYPVEQIARIDGELQQIAQTAQQQASFEAAMRSGDTSFTRKEYAKALDFYQTALSIIPDEPKALEKAAQTEKALKAIADKKLFDEHIINADKSYKKKEYEDARSLYTAALELLPNENYPKQQIEAIDKVFAQFKEYDQLIADADASFEEKAYDKAKETYRQAQTLKPSETYPPQRIKEIDAILAGLVKEEQFYKQIIANADKHFNAKKMPDAKTEYQKARAIKPDESYPIEMLQKIDDWETEQNRLAEEKRLADEQQQLEAQRQIDEKYLAIIADADNLLKEVKLVEASSKYMEALTVKPKETYPLQKLDEIKAIFFKKDAEYRQAYDEAIAIADLAFQNKQYDTARANYRKAQEAKSDESYPAEQLAKIDIQEADEARLAADEAARLAALNEKERQYAEAVAEADGLFNEQAYPG